MDSKHADGKLNLFTCDFDGKTFKLKLKLYQHMKSHLPLVKCDFCHVKLRVSSLKRHRINFHTGIKQPRKKYIPKIKSFECPICFKTLSTKQGFRIHIGDHNKTIKCKFCEKLFGTQMSLNAHIRIYHKSTKIYNCGICEQKFAHLFRLKSHQKVHDPNRLKNLKCSLCSYATDNKGNFNIHLNCCKRKNAKIAAILNPHKCPQCQVIKDSQNSLNKHINLIHTKILIECDICGRNMRTKSIILRHFRGCHKIGL